MTAPDKQQQQVNIVYTELHIADKIYTGLENVQMQGAHYNMTNSSG